MAHDPPGTFFQTEYREVGIIMSSSIPEAVPQNRSGAQGTAVSGIVSTRKMPLQPYRPQPITPPPDYGIAGRGGCCVPPGSGRSNPWNSPWQNGGAGSRFPPGLLQPGASTADAKLAAIKAFMANRPNAAPNVQTQGMANMLLAKSGTSAEPS